MIRPPPKSTLFPYPTLFRSENGNNQHGLLQTNRAKRFRHRRRARQDRRAVSQQVAYAASQQRPERRDRKSTRLNSSHLVISYAVFCLKKKKKLSDISCACRT